ncbi:glycosyltransferase family 4 protein [Variovorax sp. DAIF25]|uniref:glycosyltransferase family 4 protein n=1 Tax=Variovorax sp. DAIF25 TaxID=3080983 RepID=UPI003D6A2301
MIVVHVIVGLGVGGAEMMLRRLVAAQRESHGSQHLVFSLTEIGPIGARLIGEGFTVEAMGMKSSLYAPIAFFKLFFRIRKIEPDIVQTWMYHADFIGGLAARFAGVKRIIWGVRTTDISKGGSPITSAIRWICARISCHIPMKIVCAAEAARKAHAKLGYCEDRMLVIPNGFEMNLFHAEEGHVLALRDQCGFDRSHVVIGCMGRFNIVKDQKNFIQAAKLIAATNPRARFLMVGRGCDAENVELMNWLRESGSMPLFTLLGHRSDVATCLAAMDIFVLPSRTEGFPNALAEAMAMSRVCVSTDVGDAASVLGDCGVVVAAEDSEALAGGISLAMDLTSFDRRQLGERARLRVATEFSMDRCVEKFSAVYTEIIKS